jgi:MFS family permease
MALRSIARSFAHPNFRLFFSGQGLSLIGTQVQIVALPWFVLRLTNSAHLVGWVAFAGQFPAVFASPIAGVIADRVNKRRLLLITQSLAMVQAALLAVLTFMNAIEVWHILALSIGLSLVNAFDLPTRQSLLTEMVGGKEDLGNAIALNSAIFNATRLIGPTVAALLIAAIGEGGCFLVNALSFLAVIVALWAMRLPPRPLAVTNGSTWSGAIEGLRYTLRSTPIVAVLLITAIVSFLAVPYIVMLPVLVQRVYHGDAWLNGFLFTAAGLGALAGGLFLASRHSVLGMLKHLWLLPICTAAGLLAMSWTDSPWVAAPLIFLIGLTIVMLLTSCNMTLQSIVADHMRARVLSIYALIFLGMSPLGSLLAGWLAEETGVSLTLRLFGASLGVGAIAFAATFARPLYRQAKAQFGGACVRAAKATAEAA